MNSNQKPSRTSLGAAIACMLLLLAGSGSAQTFTYSNPAPIAVDDGATASPYGSTINIGGLGGAIAKVTITLNDVNHSNPADLAVLLVGPGGQTVALMQDKGGPDPVANQNYVFDDAADTYMPGSALSSGSFKPSDGNGNHADFASPAPAGSPYSMVLSDYIGTMPTGNWTLYVEDDNGNTLGGTIAGGWNLNITIGWVFTNSAAISIPDSGAALPYGSETVVTGVGAVTKVSVRLNGLSHTRFDDVGLLLVGPAGQRVRLSTDTGGSAAINGIDLTLDSLAANPLPDDAQIIETTYDPAGETDAGGGSPHPATFPAPAPATYTNKLSDFNGTNPNGTWSLYVDDDSAGHSGSIVGGWTLILEGSAATDAVAAISGRLTTASGRGIGKANITLSGGGLPQPRIAITNSFGFYRFTDIPVGGNYVISVSSKRHRFEDPVRVIQLYGAITGFDFVAEP